MLASGRKEPPLTHQVKKKLMFSTGDVSQPKLPEHLSKLPFTGRNNKGKQNISQRKRDLIDLTKFALKRKVDKMKKTCS